MHAPDIRQLPAKTLVGLKLRMTLAADQTPSLWRSFMPRRAEIEAVANPQLYALQVYPADYFQAFDPARPFDKWAAVEVSALTTLPPGMASFHLPAGAYAVFHYQGPAGDPSIFQYIFGTWLPRSDYALADRPHFELLPPDYQAKSPHASEEIWLPVQPKSPRTRRKKAAPSPPSQPSCAPTACVSHCHPQPEMRTSPAAPKAE